MDLLDEDAEQQESVEEGEKTSSSKSRLVGEREDQKYPWARSRVRVDDPFVMILTRGELKYDVAKSEGALSNKFGQFSYEDAVGTHFGTQWVSRTDKFNIQRKRQKKAAPAKPEAAPANSNKPRGRLHVLPCTPELWCRSLLHRTQIIYGLDASLICFHLDLLPGSVVAESGTGSGSLSLAMARAVAPTGHVNTFEFNKSRVEAAQRDFKMLGVSDLVTVRHSDAMNEGFPGAEGKCNAVFLDLPKPWVALPNCIKALRTDVETRLCSFSPCIEQVQKTCEALRELGFFQIRTFECVFREFETYRLQERVPKMWEETKNSDELKIRFNPALQTGATCVNSDMATHTGYLTFCSRFPLLLSTTTTTASSLNEVPKQVIVSSPGTIGGLEDPPAKQQIIRTPDI